MSTAYVIVTIVAAVAVIGAAAVDIVNAPWVLGNMSQYGVPRSWWLPLAGIKAIGGLGLLVGLGVPLIGVAAAVGLVLYFIGAVITVVRARCYSHIPFPVPFLLLSVASLALWPAA